MARLSDGDPVTLPSPFQEGDTSRAGEGWLCKIGLCRMRPVRPGVPAAVCCMDSVYIVLEVLSIDWGLWGWGLSVQARCVSSELLWGQPCTLPNPTVTA